MHYQIPISIYIHVIMYLWPVCTNVNNYVIFVPHVPIYWSERINKVEVEVINIFLINLFLIFKKRKPLILHIYNHVIIIKDSVIGVSFLSADKFISFIYFNLRIISPTLFWMRTPIIHQRRLIRGKFITGDGRPLICQHRWHLHVYLGRQVIYDGTPLL